MTEAAMPPATGDEQAFGDGQPRDRLDVDPSQEPNAPNRDPVSEVVGRGLDANASPDQVSDDDDLDKPDGPPAV